MAKYFGNSSASKVYPKRMRRATVGIELDKAQATRVVAAIANYLASPDSDSKRLIMTAYKKNTGKKSGNVPLSFIAGKH